MTCLLRFCAGRTVCNPLSLSLYVSLSAVFAVNTQTFTTVHECHALNETAFLYVFVTSLAKVRYSVMYSNETMP